MQFYTGLGMASLVLRSVYHTTLFWMDFVGIVEKVANK